MQLIVYVGLLLGCQYKVAREFWVVATMFLCYLLVSRYG